MCAHLFTSICSQCVRRITTTTTPATLEKCDLSQLQDELLSGGFWCSVSSQFIRLISSMFLLCLFYLKISSVFFLILCLCKICFLSFFVTLHDLYPVLGLHFLQFSDKIIAFHTKLTLIDKLDAPNDWCSSVDSSGIRVFIFIQNSGKHQDYWFSNQRTNDELHDLNEAFHSHFVWRRERRFHNSNTLENSFQEINNDAITWANTSKIHMKCRGFFPFCLVQSKNTTILISLETSNWHMPWKGIMLQIFPSVWFI